MPNSGRPAASLAAPTLLFGTLKFARSKMLNSCAMNSARVAPMRKIFDNRRSTFANPGQSTVVTSLRLRPRRNALTASRFMSRQPLPGRTPGGRSAV